jgi:hypothetical protein
MIEAIRHIISQYDFKGRVISVSPLGKGLINRTMLIMTENAGKREGFVLQKINNRVFNNPRELMENYSAVTAFLRNKIQKMGASLERETVSIIKTRDGRDYYLDTNGDYWRMITYVTDSVCYDIVESPQQIYEGALALGRFQSLLSDYPADALYETVPNFHNTPHRFAQLTEAVKSDEYGRTAEVMDEIAFAYQREAFAHTLNNAHREGRLPIRVTHNDTKISNILFDSKNGKALCVIDLDTVMRGYSVNDFGDFVRSCAMLAAKNEKDPYAVHFDLSLYELCTKGFIDGAGKALNDSERELLPVGAIMMTYECGIRYLADYLSGDKYFKTESKKQNLHKARKHFRLVSDMEQKFSKMQEIVNKYSQK